MTIRLFIFLTLIVTFASCKKSDHASDAAESKNAADDIIAYIKQKLSETVSSTPARKDSSTSQTERPAPSTEPPDSSPSKQFSNASSQETNEFKASYDSWTRKALSEFPELGIANSKINALFVARAKSMREENSPDLKYPNWPYVLALQINRELTKQKAVDTNHAREKQSVNPSTGPLNKPSGTISESEKNGVPISQSKSGVQPTAPPKEDATWTVKELSKLATIPSKATVKGTVTKIQKQIAGDPFDVILTLDNLLTCEINVRQLMQTTESTSASPYYGVTRSSDLELIYESSSVRLRQKDVSTTVRNYPYDYYYKYWYTNRSSVSVNKHDLLVIKIGDEKAIKGILTRKANGKVVLRGQLER